MTVARQRLTNGREGVLKLLESLKVLRHGEAIIFKALKTGTKLGDAREGG